MTIRKQPLKSKSACKVTFKIPSPVSNSVKSAWVVGEFNGWSPLATPMKRSKAGGFSATVELETGRDYQFRYLLGQSHWENDPEADDFVPTPFGDSQNSVIRL